MSHTRWYVTHLSKLDTVSLMEDVQRNECHIFTDCIHYSLHTKPQEHADAGSLDRRSEVTSQYYHDTQVQSTAHALI